MIPGPNEAFIHLCFYWLSNSFYSVYPSFFFFFHSGTPSNVRSRPPLLFQLRVSQSEDRSGVRCTLTAGTAPERWWRVINGVRGHFPPVSANHCSGKRKFKNPTIEVEKGRDVNRLTSSEKKFKNKNWWWVPNLITSRTTTFQRNWESGKNRPLWWTPYVATSPKV